MDAANTSLGTLIGGSVISESDASLSECMSLAFTVVYVERGWWEKNISIEYKLVVPCVLFPFFLLFLISFLFLFRYSYRPILFPPSIYREAIGYKK